MPGCDPAAVERLSGKAEGAGFHRRASAVEDVGLRLQAEAFGRTYQNAYRTGHHRRCSVMIPRNIPTIRTFGGAWRHYYGMTGLKDSPLGHIPYRGIAFHSKNC